MATHTAEAAGRRRTAARRTPAQLYCLIAGATLLVAGVAGFIADASFDFGDGIQGSDLIVFEVNGTHNLIHLASGGVLLLAAARRAPAKAVALTFGIVYGVVTVIGLIDGEDVLGLFPVDAADNILHLALAAVGIGAALASPGDDERRQTATRTAAP
jgi:Domain of unknown function (DUF4383)